MSEQLAVIGSGAIACGLAVAGARVGDVVLWARSEDSADRARASIRKTCDRLDGAVDPTRIRIVSELTDLAGADVLVEAIVEDAICKAEVLRRLGQLARPDAIVATTTSSLSIAELATASGRPDRFVGLHVFNPVVKMPLVELVFPEAASEETRARAVALCHALGKEPVIVPDVPGFVVNRLLFPYLFSAVRLMEETGLAAEAIDDCMRMGAAMPMGPLALLDFVGLDVSVAIGDAIGADVPPLLRRLVEEGALGRKTGNGLYPPAVVAA